MRTQRLFVASAFAVATGGIAACGGSGGGGGGGAPTPVVSPILIAGTTARYSGTDSIAHVYASPGPNQSNGTDGYTFTSTTTLNAAAAGAPAAFDQNAVTAYTTTQAPTSGTQKVSTTTDTFENQAQSGANVVVTTAGSKTTTVGTDVTAGLAGGGPFTITTATSTTDTTPLENASYPLVAGAVYAEPFGKTTSTTTTDTNAGGEAPAAAYVSQSSQTVANDSSYTRTGTSTSGEQTTFVESPNGSATETESGPIFALQETIGVPVLGASYTIPVSQTRQNATVGATPAPSATPGSFNAVDWYPGGALPPQPLAVETVTVKGAASTLPSGCAGALSEPNVVELDLASTDLNVDGSYQTETQQRFDSNGINVCVLRTTTTTSYAVTTGLPTQTATETFSQILTSLTEGTGTAGAARGAAKRM